MGSKRRLFQEIAPIILRDREEGQLYIEPFCGGCNSLSQVAGKRIGADVNPFLIAMLKSVISGENQFYPIAKPFYDEVRKAYRETNFKRFSTAEIGWVGYMASYNGRFFDGGYSGNGVKSKDGGVRNYIDETISDLLSQIDNLRGVELYCCDYRELEIPNDSIIYCDPPYRDTKQYSNISFDYDNFYDWVKEISKRGNKVFISEYWMPSEFREIWSKEVHCNINIEKRKRVEKLFTI